MKSLIKKIIPYIPDPLTKSIGKAALFPFGFNLRVDRDLNSLKRKMNLYFQLFPAKKNDFKNEINFLNENSKSNTPTSFIFHYPFVFNYNYEKIGEVHFDEKKGLLYIMHQEKKLYYSKDYQTKESVKNSYLWITLEQDKNSPHCYLDENFNVETNDVVADIGAAEGNFSLDVVEKASHLYIFESDSKWLEALQATFEPWKEKVTIINKLVTNTDNKKCISLNGFFCDKMVNFIKMDVEGEELKILKKAGKILKNENIKLAICTYHKNSHAKEIARLLDSYKFNIWFTNGYLLNIYSTLKPPYYRRGLLRAKK